MRQRGLERPSREEKQSREWHDQCVLRLAWISPRKLLRIVEPSAPEDTPGFSSGFSVFTPDHAGRSRNIVRGGNCAIGKYQIAVGEASTGRIFSWPTSSEASTRSGGLLVQQLGGLA